MLLAISTSVALLTTATCEPMCVDEPGTLQELLGPASVTRDALGVAHIQAQHLRDAYVLAGWVQAEDRLFQMDYQRKVGSGRLAELLGAPALPTDVQLRTLGLRRAAARSLAVLRPETVDALEAYASGVNAWIARNPLPPEYALLELTSIEPWQPLDSITVGRVLSYSLGFSLDISNTERYLAYVAGGAAGSFDGHALFHEDSFRSAGFSPASTLLDAGGAPPYIQLPPPGSGGTFSPPSIDLALAAQAREDFEGMIALAEIIKSSSPFGSNAWGVSGALTSAGDPLLANDPHLPLDVPATWYPMHLIAPGLNATGTTIPGLPSIVLGHNERIAWGATTNHVDITDVYQEQIVMDAASPSGLSIVHMGVNEPIIPIPEVYRANQLDGVPDNAAIVPPGGQIPPATLIVPRRNRGPVIALDVANHTALTVQYSGFSATRELDAFLLLPIAQNLQEFRDALEYYDHASQSFAYSDIEGNIAYITTAEMPIREDLQAGAVNGLPPWFIRNGTGGNEWLPVQNPQPNQALPYEILASSEQAQLVNPPTGWFVNANNDPVGVTLDNDPLNQLRTGGGLYYIGYSFVAGMRAGRITERLTAELAGAAPVDGDSMEALQSDTVLYDAQVLVPYILAAFASAGAPGSDPLLATFAGDPELIEAVGRLAAWDFTTPTGIPEGYDASDVNGVLSAPLPDEVASSVAATIYALWRSSATNALNAPLVALSLPTIARPLPLLRALLDDFATGQGVGASGIDFFPVAGASSREAARDVVLLLSLRQALDRLASAEFASAFAMSTSQDDYRWGKLHRIVLDHPLGGPFSIPTAGGSIPNPLPGLPGLPVDGGFDTVDVGSHAAHASGVNGFRFGAGASKRFVAECGASRIFGRSSLPGGVSGVLGSPHYADLLLPWLTNESYTLLLTGGEVSANGVSVTEFVNQFTRYCSSTTNSTGSAGRLDGEGTFSVSAGDATLIVSDCPASTIGLFVYGATPGFAPYGSGNLCLSPFAPGIFRMFPMVATDATGGGSVQIPFGTLSPAGAIVGGSTHYFQYLFRDHTPTGSTFNLTEGLGIAFCP